MRRLIINADDFGFTSGVNRAIVEAHSRGVVTSATLMATGKAFDEAARLASTVPRLSVGCHVVLIDGKPVLDPAQIPTLIGGADQARARFVDSLSRFAFRALVHRLEPNEVEAEAAAQIRKLQAAGITVSHLDTHKHSHIFPTALKALLRAARACGVGAVRNPFEPPRLIGPTQLSGSPSLWKRSGEVWFLRRLAGPFRQAVREAGLVTPDGTVGIVTTGVLDQLLFRAIVERIPDGTWEFVCHPGYVDDDLAAAGTRLRKSREKELHLLTSPEVRELLSRQDIELVSYRDLVGAH